MRGLYLEGGRFSLRDDLPALVPRAGWSRVRVLCAGICATDLALQRGYMDFAGVPGHEFVGVALDGPLAGRRVVGEINAGCGACDDCRGGDPRHCEGRTVLGILGHAGAFAEELALPDGNLLAVPDSVSDAAATFVEPLAAALQIAEQVALSAGQRALVAGDGRLGLLCAWVLALHDLEVTVAGRHPERQSLLPATASHVTGWLEGDAPACAGFDLAVEATGSAEVLPRLLPLIRPRGTIVLKTTTEHPTTADLSAVVVNELTVIGSRCGRFTAALDVLSRDRVPVESLIVARYPLERGEEAFEVARQGLKVLIGTWFVRST